MVPFFQGLTALATFLRPLRGLAEIRVDVMRFVTEALRKYVERRRQVQFEAAMARMAADPAIRSECMAIDEAFRVAEGDGLEARR